GRPGKSSHERKDDDGTPVTALPGTQCGVLGERKRHNEELGEEVRVSHGREGANIGTKARNTLPMERVDVGDWDYAVVRDHSSGNHRRAKETTSIGRIAHECTRAEVEYRVGKDCEDPGEAFVRTKE